MIPEIRIQDYNYPLSDERIAKYPLPVRDSSKLLIYKDGTPSEKSFKDIPEFLPQGSLMVFNDTKVVPARLHFQRETGAHIEIFCLEPVSPQEYVTMFEAVGRCTWKCIVGNAKKWKGDVLRLYNPGMENAASELDLRANLVEKMDQACIVEFEWSTDATFSAVLNICGAIPIPPYLNRESEEIDQERYQTMYARFNGSVAAPTAGLHFTEAVMNDIRRRGIQTDTVCLHVGAGTFLPVKSTYVSDHTMHRETFVVTLEFLERLIGKTGKLIAVGTTSVRTLESLYYVGVKCLETGAPGDVGQWEPYSRDYTWSLAESLTALADYLKANDLRSIQLGTRIIIVPGYRFRVVDVLVTNFHQPQSTLLLLISAFVGGDWKTIYDFALTNDFRFLSYGDSSLLFRE